MHTRVRIASILCAPLVLALLAGCDAKDIHVLSATGDTYVSAQAPTQNFSTATDLGVKTDSVHGVESIALMNFQPTDAGVNAADLNTAVLRVHLNTSPTTTGIPMLVPKLQAFASGPFSTNSVTWKTRPGLHEVISTNDPPDNGWVNFDVTSAVRTAIAASQKVHFAILSTTPGADLSITSSESPDNHAGLIVVANGSTGTTSPGTTSPGTTSPGTTSPGTTSPGTTSPGTTSPGTTSPPTTTPQSGHHGANQGAEIYGSAASGHYTQGLDLIQQAGAQWTRTDVPWSGVQAGGPSSYNWSNADGFIRAAESRGIHVLVSLDYTPQWARDNACKNLEHCEPATNQLDAYATYAKAAVNRYKPGGTAGTHVTSWEIWNEPDLGMFWAPSADPQRYTQMLKLAYPQMKAADPSATVIAGALASADNTRADMNPFKYLDAMYAAGAHGSFDALSIHPYTANVQPMTAASWNLFYMSSPGNDHFHAVLSNHGDGDAKIWGTEYGWPTKGSGSVSEAQQANFTKQAIAQWDSRSYSGPLFWWSLDDGNSGSSDPFSNYGLVTSNFNKKPAYNAWASMM